jgi:hypothetical protein
MTMSARLEKLKWYWSYQHTWRQNISNKITMRCIIMVTTGSLFQVNITRIHLQEWYKTPSPKIPMLYTRLLHMFTHAHTFFPYNVTFRNTVKGLGMYTGQTSLSADDNYIRMINPC